MWLQLTLAFSTAFHLDERLGERESARHRDAGRAEPVRDATFGAGIEIDCRHHEPPSTPVVSKTLRWALYNQNKTTSTEFQDSSVVVAIHFTRSASNLSSHPSARLHHETIISTTAYMRRTIGLSTHLGSDRKAVLFYTNQ